MSDNPVSTQVDPRGVATVTLDRPDKRNAFDDAIIAALTAAFTALGDREDARVVVLASAGKHFSAGADLAWMKRMAGYDYADNLADARALAAMLQALSELPQPTIARVQGAAYGGAVGLVSCCDMAVASPGASFCLSEVKIGLIPATISPYVVRAIGERAARRYFTTAEPFDAREALHLGLVSRVDEDPDAALSALVDALLANGPVAVRQAKRLVGDVAGQALNRDLIEDTCARIAALRVSDEGQEGLGAFLDKRPPRWSED
jgi:methylglutaconyl-CoA hydratase